MVQSDYVLLDTKVKFLPLHSPVSINENASLADTLRLLIDNKVGCLAICKDKKVVGVFTERDLIKRVLNKEVSYQIEINKLMSKTIYSASLDSTVCEVIKIMSANNIRHVILVDKEDQLSGIVSVRNIIDYLSKFYPEEIYNLPPDLNQIPYTVEGG